MEENDMKAFWLNTIFKEKYQINKESDDFVEVLFYQMCSFRTNRPNDNIFKGFFELPKIHFDEINVLIEKLKEENLNFDIITASFYVSIFDKTIRNCLFANEPNKRKYKRADITKIVQALMVTLILMKDSNIKPSDKIVFNYGEFPLVIEKSNGKFRSILSSHIPDEPLSNEKIIPGNEMYWPFRWSIDYPENFKIENYILRILKHENYTPFVRYAIEDFYCKCPWKEDECLNYLITYSIVTQKPLYYSMQDGNINEEYRCYYCKNIKQEKKPCMHCAITKGETQEIKQEKCLQCDQLISNEDYILLDQSIYHYNCYID